MPARVPAEAHRLEARLQTRTDWQRARSLQERPLPEGVFLQPRLQRSFLHRFPSASRWFRELAQKRFRHQRQRRSRRPSQAPRIDIRRSAMLPYRHRKTVPALGRCRRDEPLALLHWAPRRLLETHLCWSGRHQCSQTPHRQPSSPQRPPPSQSHLHSQDRRALPQGQRHRQPSGLPEPKRHRTSRIQARMP